MSPPVNETKISKQTSKPSKRASLPELSALKPSYQKFVREYVKNGGNATRAYIAAKPNVSNMTAGSNGPKLLGNTAVQRSIVALLDAHGATEENVSKRLSSMLHSEDAWTSDRGITHLRAIRGLDAPKHVQIDKRSVNVTIKAEASRDALANLITKTKKS